MRQPTILGMFPAPDPDGAGVKQAIYYLVWWPVYRTTRVLRHRLGWHDWESNPGLPGRWCHWCGERR